MESILTVDVGNSLTKLGCFIDGQLEAVEHFHTGGDEWDGMASHEAGALAAMAGRFDGAVVSSVVPAAHDTVSAVLETLLPKAKILWLPKGGSGLKTGPVDFSAYAEGVLGTDRLANVVAAQAQMPDTKLMVCSFGTAATFDLIDADGTYAGGAIAPGPRKFQSLLGPAHTAQLAETDIFEKPQHTPGLDTASCIATGLHYGYKGMILELAGNLLQNSQWLLPQVSFIFTGGDAPEVMPMVTFEIPRISVDTGLTLKGLYKLWQLNPQPVAV